MKLNTMMYSFLISVVPKLTAIGLVVKKNSLRLPAYVSLITITLSY